MNVTGQVWLELTKAQRISRLETAANNNAKKMKKTIAG